MTLFVGFACRNSLGLAMCAVFGEGVPDGANTRVLTAKTAIAKRDKPSVSLASMDWTLTIMIS
jgi:hypothetical protein